MSSFRLAGLEPERFAALFALTDTELRERNMQRVIATSSFGFPCRVGLVDAAVGDELLLVPYEHQPAASPYQSSGPIFMRKGALQVRVECDVIPDYVRRRAGDDAAVSIRKLFSNGETSYIHLHNAARGCFSCVALRV